jgi:group I intron endonuclease
MENVFKECANKGGVYRILNKKNGREYFGSTARFKQRAREHLLALKNNKHYNAFLQRDFNKCGIEMFQFEVLEVVEEPDNKDKRLWSSLRTQAEQKYLDSSFDNRCKCYNGMKDAIDLGYHPWESDRKEKMSKIMSEVYSSPEKKEQAKNHAEKRWNLHSANITVTHKSGETVLIDGSIRDFCKSRDISYKAFHLMVQGKTKSSGGWFLGKEEPEYIERKGEKRKPLTEEHKSKIAGGKYSGVILKNKLSGETFSVGANAKADCKQRNISYSSFQKMMNGKCQSAGGWIRA